MQDGTLRADGEHIAVAASPECRHAGAGGEISAPLPASDRAKICNSLAFVPTQQVPVAETEDCSCSGRVDRPEDRLSWLCDDNLRPFSVVTRSRAVDRPAATERDDKQRTVR